MKKYELMYIIRPDMEEEAQNSLTERFHKILTDNGAEVAKVEDRGKKRLAYEINDYRDGYYVLVNFTSGEEAVNEFNRQAKYSDDIIRHMIIRDEQ